jgi:hypothetical protein
MTKNIVAPSVESVLRWLSTTMHPMVHRKNPSGAGPHTKSAKPNDKEYKMNFLLKYDFKPVDVAEMVENADNKDIMALIVELDRRVADYQFTEKLIRDLAKSLRDEGNQAEWEKFIDSLKKVK